jgi:hypothetical protein
MSNCDACTATIDGDGHTTTKPGYGGRVTLVFCDDCWRSDR